MRQPKKTYAEKLKDPRWIELREKVLERDSRTCQGCGSSTQLHVHHLRYAKSRDPWDVQLSDLVTFCKRCHEGQEMAISLFRRAISSLSPDHATELAFRVYGGVHRLSHTSYKDAVQLPSSMVAPLVILRAAHMELELTHYLTEKLPIDQMVVSEIALSKEENP